MAIIATIKEYKCALLSFCHYSAGDLTVYILHLICRKFDGDLVKNVIVSKNPFLARIERFISPTWVNLEYIELSYLGAEFSTFSDSMLTNLFEKTRPSVNICYL